jgi:DNA-binding NtrC family response regulator
MSRSAISAPVPRAQTALLISPNKEDHEIFGELFHRRRWTLEHASSIDSASLALNKKAISLVITERDLPSGDWKNVLDVMLRLPESPLVIVVSQLADEHLWAEALNLGVYDVLAKPLDDTEVSRSLMLAWTHGRQAPAAPAVGARG